MEEAKKAPAVKITVEHKGETTVFEGEMCVVVCGVPAEKDGTNGYNVSGVSIAKGPKDLIGIHQGYEKIMQEQTEKIVAQALSKLGVDKRGGPSD